MAFADPERCKQRLCLLEKLKKLLCQVGDDSRQDCKHSGAVIEIYDPLPKPAVPLCQRPCCPTNCAVITQQPSPCLLPACLPICTPVCTTSIPICNPYPQEQPCVPCNPPDMMVCYRRPKENIPVKRSKSRELRASILYIGCDCERRNGLQDDCRRSECFGSPPCLTKPDPTCGPSEFANGKHLYRKRTGSYGSGKNLEQYQCYPAYVRLPNCPPCNRPQTCGQSYSSQTPPPCNRPQTCGQSYSSQTPPPPPQPCSYVPLVQLIAQAPCPPCPVAKSPIPVTPVVPASCQPPLCLQPPAIYYAPVCPC